MDYAIDVFDTWGRRVASCDDVPLLEVTRANIDQEDRIHGLLPVNIDRIGPGYLIRVRIDGVPFCDARVTAIGPQWGGTRKLILDRYVTFHELLEVDATRERNAGNHRVARAYIHRPIGEIVKDVINATLGRVHYTVAHGAYPDGAQREYDKFLARKTAENELEISGISSGQWVGAPRIDASGAFAKDGDTISGLVVDGVPWPDLRLMMVDAEELTRNSHAIKRHPEVAGWSAQEYARSGYAVNASDAKAALESLIATHGIAFIELNPHRDASGAFDDRVDAFGRYIGLVYGGGRCFNAALVELGHSSAYLYEDGKYHVPEMQLKDYFSYMSPNSDSVDPIAETLANFDVTAGIFEILTALAYAAGGCIWDVDHAGRVRFRRRTAPDHVLYFDPLEHSVTLGSSDVGLANALFFEANPELATLNKTYTRADSIGHFGFEGKPFLYFSISVEDDADRLCSGLLDDLAYPSPEGSIVFRRGHAGIAPGDVIEVRGAELRRFDPGLDGEWNGVFANRMTARVSRVTHRFQGREVITRLSLTSPLRSVENPLSYMVASQPRADELFQFRLDAATVGCDLGYHLD